MEQPRPNGSVEDHAAFDVLSILSKKWNPVVVVALADGGPMGFNDLLESIPGLSGKVLSETLADLTEAGVLQRTVLSESPLRVEYELTEAGEELYSLFDALAAWGNRHLGSSAPTVLIADPSRQLTEMYGAWLTERYDVRRAHNGEELERRFADDPDVVVFERELPGTSPDDVIDDAGPECRTIMLLSDRADADLLEIGCDDVLQKPIVRETTLEAVEEQLSRRGEPAKRRRRAAIAARRSLFESRTGEPRRRPGSANDRIDE